MTDRIALEPYEGAGGNGPIYGAEVEDLPCRFEGRRRIVNTADGSEVVSSATVFLRPDAPASPLNSRVTYGDRVYRVLEELPQNVPGQAHHREVILG